MGEKSEINKVYNAISIEEDQVGDGHCEEVAAKEQENQPAQSRSKNCFERLNKQT